MHQLKFHGLFVLTSNTHQQLYIYRYIIWIYESWYVVFQFENIIKSVCAQMYSHTSVMYTNISKTNNKKKSGI